MRSKYYGYRLREGIFTRCLETALKGIASKLVPRLSRQRRDLLSMSSTPCDATETLARGFCPAVLRLGPRRLFARPGCLVVDRDTRRMQPGQQYSSYRGRIESNILGVWWMCLAALQSERQVQLLAKVLNDEIDLIVSHDRCYHFAIQLGSTHENRAVRDWTATRCRAALASTAAFNPERPMLHIERVMRDARRPLLMIVQ